MKNKIKNKFIKTLDFKRFNLFLAYSLQKINNVFKDKNLTKRLSQELADLFTQQPVAQLSIPNASLFSIQHFASKQLNPNEQ